MTTPASADRQDRRVMGSAPSQGRIRNAMSIDVEDYFQVSAFAPYIQRGDWDHRECRVERNVGRILDLLDGRGVKATFFTLGWIAQRYPQLVRDIVARGHELASHGYGHERASDLSPTAFREDILSAKHLLEDLGGVAVKGYRAPSFSIGESNLWAFDVLADCGYRYSSSVYPIEHDHYGMPDSPRFAYEVRPGLIEVPVTTLRFRGRNYPSSGGGWFRLLPYGVTRWMIERFNRIEGRSAVFYFHPWEIDPAQPRIDGIDAKTRFRHYVNIGRTESRIEQLLADFEWARMDELFLPSAVDQREAA
ncbi:polysaccharide deacetylase family protein (PEP-CTERM system associated) [Roseateles terrae]|uniref:Polysaccharide deacetylase family protein (PEP-CTERM system associated) n=2 Tax=Roseateles terrae TaxID=431060 RepID=A0ABR6GWW5_9BURK|nr:polysaccharide deacetylase family protein (PEP-CTERM system associated) [Roseateles terrae]